MSVGVGWKVSRLASICLVSGLGVCDRVQLMYNLFTFVYACEVVTALAVN